ncbi:MAG: DNA-binding response regulator [Verrucomicrobiales bacterium]|nr:DNA-binding response regulator [Verrucomicrobiales bacterium]
MSKIVIVDDEAPILDLIGQVCRRMGHNPAMFETGREGLAALERIRPDLMIVDLRIGDVNGLDIIQQCREDHPRTQVVMVTGYGSVETAVEAMKLGAFDYLTKPFALEDLQKTITRALQEGAVEAEALAAASPATTPGSTLPVEAGAAQGQGGGLALGVPTGEFIGESPQMKEILNLVRKIADRDSPVLLEGEFGSGKQAVARMLHNTSRRRGAPFKVLHCSSLPENLLDQELFGDGSVTAIHTIFHRAEGGTVVIDEINVMPVRLQSLLEGFLEDLNARRMTGQLPPALDFRFIATSSVSLEQLAREGKFREDLYYRISVIPMTVPPLRSRRSDIEPLIRHFLLHYSLLTHTPAKEVDHYTAKLLEDYPWPGNVGELRNAVERACSFADDERIRPADLPPKITRKVEVSDEENQELKHHLPVGTPLGDFIKKQERLFIRETLKFNDGSREKTASMLGISIATLYRKMGLKLERDKLLG